MTEFTYKSEPEQAIYIPLGDRHDMEAILRGNPAEQPLAVLAHGISWDANSQLPRTAAHYLSAAGIASLRISFCGAIDPDGRLIHTTRDVTESDLYTQMNDLGTVVKALQGGHVAEVGENPEIHVVGHSVGGLVALGAEVPAGAFRSAVLWDPTHSDLWPLEKKYLIGQRVLDDIIVSINGTGSVQNRKLHAQLDALGSTTEWAYNRDFPMFVISAGRSVLKDYGTEYVLAANNSQATGPNRQKTIEDAIHPFTNSDDVQLRLFALTATWIAEHSGLVMSQA